jgi:hypothetical protein
MEVAEALADIRSMLTALSSPWRTRKEAADHLRVSVSSIDYLAGTGKLPRKFLAGSPRFHVDDLNKLVSSEKRGDGHRVENEGGESATTQVTRERPF